MRYVQSKPIIVGLYILIWAEEMLNRERRGRPPLSLCQGTRAPPVACCGLQSAYMGMRSRRKRNFEKSTTY